MRIYKEKINSLLQERQPIIEMRVDRRTYHSYKSYESVSKNNGDLRYDYIFRKKRQWPGGDLQQWLEKCPTEIDGNIIDYGLGDNRLDRVINMELDMWKEYMKYHTPHTDHYPIPKSDGGLRIFSNLKIVNKSANEARGNTPMDSIAEDIKNYAENYGIKIIIVNKNTK